MREPDRAGGEGGVETERRSRVWSGCVEDRSDEGPVAVIEVAGDEVWMRPCVVPEDVGRLERMLAGVEGEVRLGGNDGEAVRVARAAIGRRGGVRFARRGGEEWYRVGGGTVVLVTRPTGVVVRRQEVRADEARLVAWSASVAPLPAYVDMVGGWRFADFELAAAPRWPEWVERAPSYRCEDGEVRLYEGARVEVRGFTLPVGAPAVFVVLREKWRDRPLAWTTALRADEAEALAARLTREIAAWWRGWWQSPRNPRRWRDR